MLGFLKAVLLLGTPLKHRLPARNVSRLPAKLRSEGVVTDFADQARESDLDCDWCGHEAA